MKEKVFKSGMLSLLLVAVIAIFSMPSAAMAASTNEVTVTLDGKQVSFDQPPVIQNGRTLVPMRAVFEAMGASVDWDTASQTVTSTRDGVTIVMTIGSNVMTKNGQAITLDVPAQIIGSRTLVPVRALGEAFGDTVEWDNATRSVTITSQGTTPAEPFSALAYERYPGDENAPEWMVCFKVVEYYYHTGANAKDDYEGRVIADKAYVTKPDDMTSAQWETLKEYYKDKEVPQALWHKSNMSFSDPDSWYYERIWPEKVYFRIYVDSPEYGDDATTNFVQKSMNDDLWVLYKNMLNNNPAGGNPIHPVPNIPNTVAYERYPGDENAPDWMVHHVAQVDSAFVYKEVYSTKPADMTSAEWEALKNYWRYKERPGLTEDGQFIYQTYPFYIQWLGYTNYDFVQGYMNDYIYSLYNYMVKDLSDGVADDKRNGSDIRYSGSWIIGDWRTVQ